MSERIDYSEYTNFEDDDTIDPQIPTSGPLYELFTEMLKIAENHKLSSEETWELSYDLHQLFKKRSFAISDNNDHMLDEGGSILDPLDQVTGASGSSADFFEYFDRYEPLLDGFSILVTPESESGGVYNPDFEPADLESLDDSYPEDDQ